MIVGTAGHIDHGKTSLVKALTGVDADRLPEEKARGITLDLGYAYASLPDGGTLGFVDVPGHERLVHNMLAGVTGIDFVLLVVAADDGPMPQTREHLQILDLLGLACGAVALTKIDLVTAQRTQEAREEVEALLRGCALQGAPLFPISSQTGVGIDALRGHLEQEHRRRPPRHVAGRFRLAIDRSFTLKGAGTVVTGSVHAGRIRVDDAVLLSPSAIPVRVRAIHAQNRPAPEGVAGDRCALNLTGPGFDKSMVERGQWLLDPSLHAPTQRADVRLRVLETEPRGLRHWTPIHAHIGALDVSGRVALLEGEALAPGGNGLAQLVLDRPVGVLRGDRFVIRDQSAARTIGGGVVLDPFAPQRGRRHARRLAVLRAYEHPDAGDRLRALLEACPSGIDLDRFALTCNLLPEEVDAAALACGMRRVVASGFSEASWHALRQRVLDALSAEHARASDMIGVGRERLRRLADPALGAAEFAAVLSELLAEGGLWQTGSWLHLPDHQVRLSEAEERLWSRVRPLLEAVPFHPPRVRDLAGALQVEESAMRQLLKRVSRLGEVYPVAHDHYFTRDAVVRLAEVVRDLCEASGEVRAAPFRDRIEVGRKLAIQIVEFFDRIGYTRRVRDAHVLRQPDMFASEAHAAVT